MNLPDFLATFTLTNWLITIGLFTVGAVAFYMAGRASKNAECQRRLRDQAQAQAEKLSRRAYLLNA